MLIDISYFVSGPCHLQNASAGQMASQNSVAVKETVDAYISRYQSVYLEKMLGSTVAGYVTDYLDTLDGGTAESSNVYGKIADRLRLPFSCFVCFHILRDASQEPTVTGIKSAKSTDDKVQPVSRQVTLWNEMVNYHRDFITWMNTYSTVDIVYQSEMVEKINDFGV